MPRRVGAYGKLLANYASDDAIIAAGEAAELLFCRAIAFLATSDSDGYITDGQLVRVVGAGMKDAVKRARKLVEVGLWLRDGDGYRFSDAAPLYQPGKWRPRVPRAVRRAVFIRDGGVCVFCGGTERLSLDHIYPWSLGGEDTLENLQTMCVSCNCRKGARI